MRCHAPETSCGCAQGRRAAACGAIGTRLRYRRCGCWVAARAVVEVCLIIQQSIHCSFSTRVRWHRGCGGVRHSSGSRRLLRAAVIGAGDVDGQLRSMISSAGGCDGRGRALRSASTSDDRGRLTARGASATWSLLAGRGLRSCSSCCGICSTRWPAQARGKRAVSAVCRCTRARQRTHRR